MSEKKAAHENPLIPNARLKQMYRAILRAQLLGEALPPAQRALTAGREAALVSTSLDLTARDFVSDAFSTPVIDWLRGMPAHQAVAPHSKSSRRILAESGSGTRVVTPPDATARLWSAAGIASSISSAAKKTESTAKDSAVVAVFTIAVDISAEAWKPALSFAAQYDLPLIVVVLPATSAQKPEFDLRAIAHRAHVPAMPVDAADPVALYRVAQESIGHARIGGGPALIQCVAFPATARRSGGYAALAHLEEYILSRGIAARAWMDREARNFATQIKRVKSASK